MEWETLYTHRIHDVGRGHHAEASQRVCEGGALGTQLGWHDLMRHLEHRVDREGDEEAAQHRHRHEHGHLV